MKSRLLLIMLLLGLLAVVSVLAIPRLEPLVEMSANQPAATKAAGGLAITDVTDNHADYDKGLIPRYARLEITFQIRNTVAQNFQFPYDPKPPNGIDLSDPAYQGISVDALFTPDGWKTVYRQPAFYYQYFEDQFKTGFGRELEWIYPTDRSAWKVRFSPNKVTRDRSEGYREQARPPVGPK